MQPLKWYARRLRAMTFDEMLWRARCAGRDVADRRLLGLRKRWATRPVATNGDSLQHPGYAVSKVAVGAWRPQREPTAQQAWAEQLQRKADGLAANRLTLLDLEDHDLGARINWNRNPKSGHVAPSLFAPWIDYRDFRVTGDCKFVWELNRHHHLVVLARAYRATGDVRFAQAVVNQWAGWLEQCPYGIGMNWRSPLELAIRLINWVWALDLIRPSGLVEPAFLGRLISAVYLHLWDVSRKYSRASSTNNHRIGEAAGVFMASCYFCELRNAKRWEAESYEILCHEILDQTFADGGTREQALGYHLFVTQFFFLAGIVARQTGHDFPPEYWTRLHRMLEFVSILGEGGDALPMFGDCDDGYVLDLDADPHDMHPWLALGAALFNDPELNTRSRGYPEAGHWLPQANGRDASDTPPAAPEPRPLAAHAFSDSGYYLLQCGARNSPDRISVLFDTGSLGLGALAAHGHADALSFTLRAFGVDVLVDPGTFDYFSYPPWRAYFRSTRAHNTVVVDGVDQSVTLGPFLWGDRAQARCLEWCPNERGGRVRGEHDGYGRLPSPVMHRRTLELDGNRRELLVQDEFDTQGQHEYATCFHLAEHCRVEHAGGNCCEIDVGPGRVTLELDPRLTLEMLHGSESPISGWVSRGYHRKTASTTLVGRCSQRGRLRLQTRISIGQCPSGATHTAECAAHTLEA